VLSLSLSGRFDCLGPTVSLKTFRLHCRVSSSFLIQFVTDIIISHHIHLFFTNHSFFLSFFFRWIILIPSLFNSLIFFSSCARCSCMPIAFVRRSAVFFCIIFSFFLLFCFSYWSFLCAVVLSDLLPFCDFNNL
jgi:hypothetical protein